MNKQTKALVLIKAGKMTTKEIADHVGMDPIRVTWLKSMVKTGRMTWDGKRADRTDKDGRVDEPGQGKPQKGKGKGPKPGHGIQDPGAFPGFPQPTGQTPTASEPQPGPGGKGKKPGKRPGEEPQEPQKGKQEDPEKHPGDYKHLIGMKPYIDQIDFLLEHGTKATMIGGHPGLGKSTLVTTLADDKKAKLIRIQITEMTTDFDIIGSVDMEGNWHNSEFVDNLIEAQKNPDQEYIMLLDEFTRGQNECLGVLMPVLAEKTLIINNSRSPLKQIAIPSNVKIFATGNLQDINQRQVSGAELDRYNIVEIKPIRKPSTLARLMKTIKGFTTKDAATLSKIYMASWQLSDEERIKPMSHRTLLEAARLISKRTDTNRGQAIMEVMDMTYYGTSAATLDPQCHQAYQEIMEEAI